MNNSKKECIEEFYKKKLRYDIKKQEEETSVKSTIDQLISGITNNEKTYVFKEKDCQPSIICKIASVPENVNLESISALEGEITILIYSHSLKRHIYLKPDDLLFPDLMSLGKEIVLDYEAHNGIV